MPLLSAALKHSYLVQQLSRAEILVIKLLGAFWVHVWQVKFSDSYPVK
jgi:hypothetical protein